MAGRRRTTAAAGRGGFRTGRLLLTAAGGLALTRAAAAAPSTLAGTGSSLLRLDTGDVSSRCFSVTLSMNPRVGEVTLGEVGDLTGEPGLAEPASP